MRTSASSAWVGLGLAGQFDAELFADPAVRCLTQRPERGWRHGNTIPSQRARAGAHPSNVVERMFDYHVRVELTRLASDGGGDGLEQSAGAVG
jgi:hypothetical protein